MAKKAIVMGATSGIGMEVAKLLAAKGWQVGIAGRRIERLQTLISDNKTTLQSGGTISDNKATPQGGIICYQQIDVTSAEAPSQLSNSLTSWEEWTCTSTVQALAGRTTRWI